MYSGLKEISHKYYFPTCIDVALQDYFSLKRLISSVYLPMIGKRSFFSNCFFASISTIRHFSSVDHHMSTKISFKSKMFITHMILIRHFSRVHSQMIYRTFLGAFIGFSPLCIPICTTRTLLIIN